MHLLPVVPAGSSGRFSSAAARKSKGTTKPTSSFAVSNKSIHFFDEVQIEQVIERQSKCLIPKKQTYDPSLLREAYKSCQNICAQHAKSYYLGTYKTFLVVMILGD